jgi:hypothetical protein
VLPPTLPALPGGVAVASKPPFKLLCPPLVVIALVLPSGSAKKVRAWLVHVPNPVFPSDSPHKD